MTALLIVLPHVGQMLSTTKFKGMGVSFRSRRTEDPQESPLRLCCCEDALAPCDGVSVEPKIATLPCEFVETVGSNYPQVIHSLQFAAVGQFEE
jgi:hypothetical protein